MKVPIGRRRIWFGVTTETKGKNYLGGRSIGEKIAVHTLQKKFPRIK
jgi:hypothetical protein